MWNLLTRHRVNRIPVSRQINPLISPVVTIRATSCNIQQFYVLPTQCMCFVCTWEQTAIISLYSFNWLVFITEMECVYCAVRTGSLYTASLTFSNSTFCPHSVFMCFVWIWEQKWLFPYTALTGRFLDITHKAIRHLIWTLHPFVWRIYIKFDTGVFYKIFSSQYETSESQFSCCHTEPAGINKLIYVNSYVWTDFGETWYQWRLLSLTKTGWVQLAFYVGA